MRPGTLALLGATGFVGRHVAEAARAAGWTVRPIARSAGSDGVRLDVATATPEQLADALRGCDAVVNTVGVKRRQGRQGFQEAHIDAVRTLAEACRRAGVLRLVHVSVLNARADGPHEYHRSKAAGDAIVASSGLDWTILRPSVIWGPGDDLVAHLAKMVRASPVFPVVGRGRTVMQPVHVQDVAQAVVAALTDGATVGRALDVVGPERLELRAMVQRVAAALGLRTAILPTPPQLMVAPAAVMTRVARNPLTTSGQLAILREGLAGNAADTEALLRRAPHPFDEDGIRAALPPKGRSLIDLRFGRADGTPPSWAALAGYALLASVAVLVGFRGGFLDTWTRLVLCFSMAGIAAAFLGRSLMRDAWRPTPWMIALGALAGVALYALSWAIAQAPGMAGPIAEVKALQGGHPPWVVAPTLVLAIAAEEVLWRGVLVGGLARRVPAWSAALLGTAVYAIAHVAAGSVLLVVAAAGLGLVWSLLFAATRSLVAVIVCHVTWELLAVVVLPVG